MLVLWSSGDSGVRPGIWDAYVCCLGVTLSCHLAASTTWVSLGPGTIPPKHVHEVPGNSPDQVTDPVCLFPVQLGAKAIKGLYQNIYQFWSLLPPDKDHPAYGSNSDFHLNAHISSCQGGAFPD